MPKQIKSINLTLINFIIVCYFLVLGLINLLEIDNPVVGMLREVLTIPFLLLQVYFLVIGIRFWVRNFTPFLTKVSVVALAACTLFTIGSFF